MGIVIKPDVVQWQIRRAAEKAQAKIRQRNKGFSNKIRGADKLIALKDKVPTRYLDKKE